MPCELRQWMVFQVFRIAFTIFHVCAVPLTAAYILKSIRQKQETPPGALDQITLCFLTERTLFT